MCTRTGIVCPAILLSFCFGCALPDTPDMSWVGATTFNRLLRYARANGFTAPPACAPTAPRATRAELIVAPDDGADPFLALIDGAERKIDLVIYQLGSTDAQQALIAAAG